MLLLPYQDIRNRILSRTVAGCSELDFYHANYPEGVREKRYTLQTIERGERFLLARSVEHNPVRILQIYDINYEWIVRHFTGLVPDREDIQGWLDRNL